METEIRDKRIRAIAELLVKSDKGKITEAEFSAEYTRLNEGMPPSTYLRVIALYRQMTGDAGQMVVIGKDADGNMLIAEEPAQWGAPTVPAYPMKPPTDDGAGGSSAP